MSISSLAPQIPKPQHVHLGQIWLLFINPLSCNTMNIFQTFNQYLLIRIHDPRGFPALQVYFFFCATARASDVHLGLEVSASLLLLYWQHEGPVLATCVRERTETVSSLINSSQLVLSSTVLKRLECSVGGSTMMLYFGCYFTTLLMCL